ncbi:MAG: hypothetical protein WEF50_08250 [Myxococcota bacterium]
MSGRWGFASGIRQSTWVMTGCMLEQGDPPAPVTSGIPIRHFVVPRASVTVLDTWHVGGLRGTGSTDFTIDDLFVPNERSFLMFAGPRLNDAPIFGLPSTFFGVALASVEDAGRVRVGLAPNGPLF